MAGSVGGGKGEHVAARSILVGWARTAQLGMGLSEPGIAGTLLVVVSAKDLINVLVPTLHFASRIYSE